MDATRPAPAGGPPTGRFPALAAAAAAAALWFVLWRLAFRDSPLNADEGFYLAAGKALERGLLPYRDYLYTQTPFLPLIQGPFFLFLPASLAGLRTLSFLWTALFLAGAGAFAWKSLGGLRTAGFLAVCLLCPAALGFLSIGKTYPLAQLLLLATALPLFGPGSWKNKLLVLSAAGVLCVGVRLTMAPAVAVLWAGFWLLHRAEARPVLMIGVPALLALAALGPFVAMDPVAFAFSNWTFHHDSLIPRDAAGWAADFLRFAPGPLALMAFAAARRRAWATPFGIVLGASAAGIVSNVLLAGIYPEYVTPFLFVGALGAAGMLAAGPSRRLEAAAYAAALATALATASLPARSTCLTDADAAAAFLDRSLSSDDPVLASMPEIPVQADRPLFRNLVMGKFTVTADLAPAAADRLHFIRFDDLVGALDRREPAAVVLSTSANGNFAYSLPSYRRFNERSRRKLAEALDRGYVKAFGNATYLILVRGDLTQR
jgi:hypothetical protein